MKKLLLLTVILISSISMFAADVVTAKVDGTSLSISLANQTSFVAFQMDITLPTGIKATEIAKTERLATGANVTINGESTETPFVIASNVLDGNVLRVVAYNLGNNPIKEARGEIINITLNAAPNASSDIKVSNIKFVSEADLKEMDLANVVGDDGSIPGDVDGNGEVEIDDVVMALNIYLKKIEDNGLADVDGNGEVEIDDVVMTLNIYLKKI